ncbi:lipopolysaccharide biosynthesis protein [Thermoanaerobacter mathranii subsp. mathranii str. A3]|uniref:Lipopolysaccharide biosynthesis protein n=2 Tax=Thermoanaerobacter TaxID=1754 RepID=D3T7S4_THEIA|nr:MULTISPECIES: Wzz/FepE/Etk N-terminal domain-containing protein [Thermoanaerobacter]ADD02006.1 lipopolysaccharide biosynthesis protein [Thermoanaerobacter italicus Ab9]ADH60505.1 lipopolysaccharide biosynthesis protein [Thermoanaerobacter mathranii subsp. mathranii str. A3]
MEEEISLRELIEIILKHKKTIIIVTLAATLVAVVLSFFVIKPTYEATTTLSVTDVTPETGFFGSNTTVILPGKDSNLPSVQSDSIDKDLSLLLSSLLKYPDMSVEAFKEEVTNPIVLMNTVKQLGLDPQKYTVENLKKQISVSIVNNTNLITVTVKEDNPELAAKIADTIAENFRSYIIERNNRQTDKLIETLNKLINLQNDKIRETTTKLNEIQTNSQDRLLIEQTQKQLELLKNTRDIMLEKYNMLELLKESDLGKQSILITSKALVPDKPIAPKKSLNIIIAFILGLMVSIFIVFFMEYWKNTDPKKTTVKA